MERLAGKVALVTGAGSGIGRATATLFAREGARVAIADRDPVGGQQTCDQIKADGGVAWFIETNVAREAECQRMIEGTVAHYGRLDVLHNHAGILHPLASSFSPTTTPYSRAATTSRRSSSLRITEPRLSWEPGPPAAGSP